MVKIGNEYGNEINVAVSGAAGKIADALYPRLLRDVFEGVGMDADYRVNLRLLEIPQVVDTLGGVALELQDIASPHLGDIVCTADADEAFDGVDVAILLGGRPRGPGVENRADLIAVNAPIFVEQGKALARGAADYAKVLVPANPANSNTLTTLSNATGMKPEQFASMARLDHNRAVAQLALRYAAQGVNTADIKNLAVWGNHSKSMVVDLSSITLQTPDGLVEFLDLPDWYPDLARTVSDRGDEILEARGSSSVSSAAQATADQLKDWMGGSDGRWHTMGLYSDGTHARIPEGIVSSMPVVTGYGGLISRVDPSRTNAEVESLKAASYHELEDERLQLEELGVL